MNLPPCSVDPDEDASPRCPHGDGPMRAINSCISGTKGAAWGQWWRCINHLCGFTYLGLPAGAPLLYAASEPADPEPGLATVHQIARKQP